MQTALSIQYVLSFFLSTAERNSWSLRVSAGLCRGLCLSRPSCRPEDSGIVVSGERTNTDTKLYTDIIPMFCTCSWQGGPKYPPRFNPFITSEQKLLLRSRLYFSNSPVSQSLRTLRYTSVHYTSIHPNRHTSAMKTVSLCITYHQSVKISVVVIRINPYQSEEKTDHHRRSPITTSSPRPENQGRAVRGSSHHLTSLERCAVETSHRLRPS